MTEAPARHGLVIENAFTDDDVHPYDTVEWGLRDVVMTNWRDGSVNFEQRGVEFPTSWSDNAVQIVTSKYFRGAMDTPQRESSLKQLVDRVVDTYAKAGYDNNYFASIESATRFGDELKYMLVHQMFSFNSPVWFNVGTSAPQQVSACFILAVDDSMDSILNWYREEGLIFKGGSGSGINLSRIRSSRELLSTGGSASGPVSFMRGADSSAGTIKSGGATRRAAKMVVLDVDHPDIEEFIETKQREELKIKALRDAGFDMDMGGADVNSVQYQNANNSVRVSDEFMEAVENGDEFPLHARLDGSVVKKVNARELFQKIAQAAWDCADPGIQYDDTINAWHTCPESGRITASNPCSEYVHLDNSSCNLASLNLLKFLREDNSFNYFNFERAVELVITAMDISICFADFPTEAIADTTRRYRQLGIGYANLGALLMVTGRPYDSLHGRAMAASITALMTATAYKQSAYIAGFVGSYEGYARNAEAHLNVIKKHTNAVNRIEHVPGEIGRITNEAQHVWENALTMGQNTGYRNAQASVLAPTGTIGLMMDCDTTGIEPDLALVKVKKLATGSTMNIVNQKIPHALRHLAYQPETIEAIVEYVKEHGHVVDAPGLHPDHYRVFDTAMGDRSISWQGHVKMMAAAQPFLSGAISKTVNLPEMASVEEVGEVYRYGWENGLKAVAVYRDMCKVGQPLSSKKTTDEGKVQPEPLRRRLPRRRSSQTTSFTVGGAKGYLTAGRYPDGELGELFIKMNKQGSTMAGIMDAFSIALSIGLQYGVPLEAYVSKFINTRFEPSGFVEGDPDIRMSQSLIDYIFRRLALDYLTYEQREEWAIFSIEERTTLLDASPVEPTVAPVLDAQRPTQSHDAPLCVTCGVQMRRAGSCHVCESCGGTSGCS